MSTIYSTIPFLALRSQYAAIRDEIHTAIQRVTEECAFASGPAVAAFETTKPRLLDIPTATVVEHTLLTQGFRSVSKALSLVSCDHKTAILRGQIWPTHQSGVVGLAKSLKSKGGLTDTQTESRLVQRLTPLFSITVFQ